MGGVIWLVTFQPYMVDPERGSSLFAVYPTMHRTSHSGSGNEITRFHF